MVTEKTTLERADYPEQVGVSSQAIAAYMQDLADNRVETHSILILRHGKVAFETWAAPYGPERPHTMFSVSKSVTSAAVGFAIEEGLLTLQTKVTDIFPEYRPKKRDRYLDELTVFHLLTMTVGKDVSLLADKAKNRWIEDYFKAKWVFPPGGGWRYISENTYMLSAIVAKVTGESLTQYLTPRLYEPLGFGRVPYWETDGNGVEAGGWGLFLTTEELAKFILCYLRGGRYDGKQVVPASWAQESVRKQTDNPQYTDPSATCGYGYCFWMSPFGGAYRADGFMSQSAKAFHAHDAAVITTACEISEEKSRDCLWRHIDALFLPEPLASPPNGETEPRLKPLDFPMKKRSPLEQPIQRKILSVRRKRLYNALGFPMGMLPFPTIYMSVTKAGNIDEVSFEFHEASCTMRWTEGEETNAIECGMDGETRQSPMRLAGLDFTADAYAYWEEEQVLRVSVRPLESVCRRELRFVFKGKHFKMIPSTSPPLSTMTAYLAEGVGFFIENPLLIAGARFALTKAPRIMEPVHRGRLSERRHR